MKKIKKLISICVVVLIICSIVPLTVVNAAENVYPKWQTIDGITTVRCTWYAWQQAYDNTGVALPNFGNAVNWYSRAKSAGYSVGTVAKPRSIAVWEGDTYGHVGYVVSVNGSKMTVNEGGQMYNGTAYNGDGIKNGTVCNSTAGSAKYSGSNKTLLGFIYLDEALIDNVSITHGYSGYTDTITSTNAIVHATVTKPSSYATTKFGIYIRRTSNTYENGWSYIHNASTSHVNESYFRIWFDINDEVGITLTHATSYTYKLYAVINGKEYWSEEKSFTTTGSHSYGSWTTTKAATCTVAGSKKRTCSSCKSVETASIAALGHNYSTGWTTDKAATCTTAGSKSKHCTRCDVKTSVTEIAATGHFWSAWKTTTAPTCLTIGTQKRSCSECGTTATQNIAALGHDYSENWTIDKQAGCVAEGSKSHHCQRCDVKGSVTEISATGHSWSEWTVETAATTVKNGSMIRKCKNCTASEKKTIPALATDGHTHTYGEWKTATKAGCNDNGVSERACTICGVKETVEIAAVGHQFGEWNTVKAATSEIEGLEERKCRNCDEVESRALSKLPEELPADDSKLPTNNKAIVEDNGSKEDGGSIWIYVICLLAVVVFTAGITALITLKSRKNK